MRKNAEIAGRVERRLHELGWIAAELSVAAGVSASTVSRVLSGGGASERVLRLLATTLGMSWPWPAEPGGRETARPLSSEQAALLNRWQSIDADVRATLEALVAVLARRCKGERSADDEWAAGDATPVGPLPPDLVGR